MTRTHARVHRYSAAMAFDRAQTLRGALAGAVAAGVWAIQQPLDKRIFRTDYDDVELLGKLVTRGPAWAPIGAAIHVANGAVFGAAYANAAPRMPLPSWARGPAAALAEHASSWPLMAVAARLPPARADLPPPLAAAPPAFGPTPPTPSPPPRARAPRPPGATCSSVSSSASSSAASTPRPRPTSRTTRPS